MAQINEIIISEINGMQDVSDNMKTFLKWILDFERVNIDRERPNYREEIEKKLNELLITNQKK